MLPMGLLCYFALGSEQASWEKIIHKIGKDVLPHLPSLPKVTQEEEQLNLSWGAGPNRGHQFGNRHFAGCSPGLMLERSGMP